MKRMKMDPAGAPDFVSGTDIVAQTIDKLKTDIVAQTVEKLAVDIVSQTLEKLDINIASQTLEKIVTDVTAEKIGTLGVDIKGQTVGTLAVDIAAQSLDKLGIKLNAADIVGNIPIDIKAQSITGGIPINITSQDLDKIKADIVAQTVDKLKMDLAAQTIESLDIDVYAQTIAEMIIRNKMGAADSMSGLVNVPAGSEAVPFSITGKGILLATFYRVNPATDSHKLYFYTSPDGAALELRRTFIQLHEDGFTASSNWQQLLSYTPDGYCAAMLVPPAGATFESSLELHFHNSTSSLLNVGWAITYATV